MGATIGDAMLGKKLGKKAMLLGALAQSLPDIDFIASFWNNTASNLLAHRGFTHSLLFDLLVTIVFALLADHYHKQHRVGYTRWLIFFGVQISIHLFIDLFNSYGMGLLEPFSHERFSFNAMFVADPFFSIAPAVSFVALLILKSRSYKRLLWQRVGIIIPAIYLAYCSINKMNIGNAVDQILIRQKISSKDVFTTPTPLNNWLWYIAIKTDSGFLIGYRSVFDRKVQADFHFFPRNDSLLQSVSNDEEIQHLIRFSKGYYTVEKWHDTIVFNDLRFGQMIGWHDPNERFVFHYYLQKNADNKLVVQRGRFAGWTWNSTRSLTERIQGN